MIALLQLLRSLRGDPHRGTQSIAIEHAIAMQMRGQWAHVPDEVVDDADLPPEWH